MCVRESARMNDNTFYPAQTENRQRLTRFRAIVLALFLAGGAGTFTWTQVQANEGAKPAPMKLTASPALRSDRVSTS